jgi:hypothetical protein
MWPLGLLLLLLVESSSEPFLKDGTYYVVALSVRLAVRGHLQFSGLFFAIFAAIGLKLGVLLCSQELLFQFAFRIY